MIYFFSPYSFEKKFFCAYDKYVSLVNNPDDWICFLDGDTMFLSQTWGHDLKKYTEKYPDAGMLTCYASRAGYPSAIPKEGNNQIKDILFHRNVSEKLRLKYLNNCVVKPYNRRVSGHLMLMKRGTWDLIKNGVKKRVNANNKKILGVDTQISYEILSKGKSILLMRGIYILHYFRLHDNSKTHLL